MCGIMTNYVTTYAGLGYDDVSKFKRTSACKNREGAASRGPLMRCGTPHPRARAIDLGAPRPPVSSRACSGSWTGVHFHRPWPEKARLRVCLPRSVVWLHPDQRGISTATRAPRQVDISQHYSRASVHNRCNIVLRIGGLAVDSGCPIRRPMAVGVAIDSCDVHECHPCDGPHPARLRPSLPRADVDADWYSRPAHGDVSVCCVVDVGAVHGCHPDARLSW